MCFLRFHFEFMLENCLRRKNVQKWTYFCIITMIILSDIFNVCCDKMMVFSVLLLCDTNECTGISLFSLLADPRLDV